MKIRNGFVSNSSSSSFIIKTEGLDPKVLTKIYHFFAESSAFNTEIDREEDGYIFGELEAHWASECYDMYPSDENAFDDLMETYDVEYVSRYGDYVCPKCFTDEDHDCEDYQ